MQVFEDVLASGQLGLRTYSKSTSVEASSHQWDFCHYWDFQAHFSSAIPMSFFWTEIPASRKAPICKGWKLKEKRHYKTWHLVHVSKALAVPFLQWKQPANMMPRRSAQEWQRAPPPTGDSAPHPAQSSLLTAVLSSKVCPQRETWALPMLENWTVPEDTTG